MSVLSSLHPQIFAPLPPYFSHSAHHYGRPCPPEWDGGLAEVVNGQPEHVIGAHP